MHPIVRGIEVGHAISVHLSKTENQSAVVFGLVSFEKTGIVLLAVPGNDLECVV